MDIIFAAAPTKDTQPHVVFTFERDLTEGAKDMDGRVGGALTRALEASRFKGKVGEVLDLRAPNGINATRLMLVGLGKQDKFNALAAAKVGGAIYGALAMSGETGVQVVTSGARTDKMDETTFAATLGQGALLRSWRCDRFKTKQKEDEKPALKEVTVITSDHTKAQSLFTPLEALAKGVFFTREVVTLPPNILFPLSYAKLIKEELTPLGVEVEILELATITKMGMGALVGVGQGSVQDSCVVVMQWKGGAKDAAPVAFIGKGVTFDT
ncbi:MAG: leucyl aminopeptidase, partial [Proteobacteria bacterium]|nr:leucyl aminopeptidase [Pseudomonadota bacterium]